MANKLFWWATLMWNCRHSLDTAGEMTETQAAFVKNSHDTKLPISVQVISNQFIIDESICCLYSIEMVFWN